jgi:hypothetical protein
MSVVIVRIVCYRVVFLMRVVTVLYVIGWFLFNLASNIFVEDLWYPMFGFSPPLIAWTLETSKIFCQESS